MIAWSDKIKKSQKIFPGVVDVLQKQKIDIDGVIEVFNDGVEQGTLMKIFDTYNPEVDMVIWAYLPKERDCNNQMIVRVGHQSDCTENNMWKDNVQSKVITQAKAIDLHNEVRNYIVGVISSKLDKKIDIREVNNE